MCPPRPLKGRSTLPTFSPIVGSTISLSISERWSAPKAICPARLLMKRLYTTSTLEVLLRPKIQCLLMNLTDNETATAYRNFLSTSREPWQSSKRSKTWAVPMCVSPYIRSDEPFHATDVRARSLEMTEAEQSKTDHDAEWSVNFRLHHIFGLMRSYSR
jgi:hypothetical protein